MSYKYQVHLNASRYFFTHTLSTEFLFSYGSGPAPPPAGTVTQFVTLTSKLYAALKLHTMMLCCDASGQGAV